MGILSKTPLPHFPSFFGLTRHHKQDVEVLEEACSISSKSQ